MLSMSPEPVAYRLLIADVYELAGASRRTSEAIAARQGQTAARWHVMSVLSGSPMSVSAAARRLGLTRQSVQRVVDHLATSGHVVLAADPTDRRAPLVTLTPQGHHALADLVASSDRQREDVVARAGVGAAELAAAREVLQALVAALDAAHS